MSVESVLQRVAAIEQALSNPASMLAITARTGGTAAPVQPTGPAVEPGTSPGGASFAEALQSASASYPPTTAAGTLQPAASTLQPAAVGAATLTPAQGLPDTGTVGAATLTPTQGLPGTETVGAAMLKPTQGLLGTGTPVIMGQRIVAIAEGQIGQTEQPPGSNEGPAIAQYRTATAGAMPGAPWCAYFASWAARAAGQPLGAQSEGLGSVGQIWSWAQSSGRAIPNGPGVTPQPGDLIVFGNEHVGIVKGVLPNGDIQTIEGNYENKVAANVRTPTEATGYVNMN
ncbi:MAG TPA: CHAP domain-containing protein [Solirubrobacteraceae bacterium]|jgi:hypothetical protein|nr:CHAP domain-containing protein [Solirubrobacteraceae bacterium]